MSDPITYARGLLDTSVVVDLAKIAVERLPATMSIAAITLAELAAGTHATRDVVLRAQRQRALQQVEASFTTIAFDARAARAYGEVWAAVSTIGRKPRGGRAVNLLIAATAIAEGVPLWTRDAEDFAGLEQLLVIVPV